jgi:hypothetical protein
VWYTIEYLDQRNNAVVAVPVIFAEKEEAIANALALLRAGFSVSKVTGPSFEMNRTALTAYGRSRRNGAVVSFVP